MEYSFFMIKPVAYKYRDEILEIITQKLNIESTLDMKLNEEFLNKLYASEKEEFRKVNTMCLKDQLACLGVVSGENAKTKLVEICGDKPIGEDCAENSIRYIYRTNQLVSIAGKVFYFNAIHKSSPDEADYEVRLYEDVKKEIESLIIDSVDNDESFKNVIEETLIEEIYNNIEKDSEYDNKMNIVNEECDDIEK